MSICAPLVYRFVETVFGKYYRALLSPFDTVAFWLDSTALLARSSNVRGEYCLCVDGVEPSEMCRHNAEAAYIVGIHIHNVVGRLFIYIHRSYLESLILALAVCGAVARPQISHP